MSASAGMTESWRGNRSVWSRVYWPYLWKRAGTKSEALMGKPLPAGSLQDDPVEKAMSSKKEPVELAICMGSSCFSRGNKNNIKVIKLSKCIQIVSRKTFHCDLIFHEKLKRFAAFYRNSFVQ